MSEVNEVSIPADDLNRHLAVKDPDDASLSHVAVVGDTYAILLSGKDTAGHYCLIDMEIPMCGGPSPHRHDFEEMFYGGKPHFASSRLVS